LPAVIFFYISFLIQQRPPEAHTLSVSLASRRPALASWLSLSGLAFAARQATPLRLHITGPPLY